MAHDERMRARMAKSRALWCGLVLILAAGGPAAAGPGPTVLRVNPSAPPGGDGSSWSAAFNDLQAALAAANAIPAAQRDVQIWLSAGVYRPGPPGSPRSATFAMIGGVELAGGFEGAEAAFEERNP